MLGNTLYVKEDANKVVVVVFVDATSGFDRHIYVDYILVGGVILIIIVVIVVVIIVIFIIISLIGDTRISTNE